MECLDTETLCMYMDNELDASMRDTVEATLQACDHCADQLQSLQRHDTMLQTAWQGEVADPPAACDCCDASQLSGFVSRQLPDAEMALVEQRIHTCEACLHEVVAMRRMMRLLTSEPLLTPPPHLAMKARAEFATSERSSVVEQLGTMVVQVARNGLKFIESLGLPEAVQFSVGGQLAPAGALRSTRGEAEADARVNLQQTVGDLELQIHILHEDGETVLLQIGLQKQGQPLARKRVALLSEGRTRYSNRTSDAGAVEFPRVPPGEYTVRVAQEKIETQLVLQPL